MRIQSKVQSLKSKVLRLRLQVRAAEVGGGRSPEARSANRRLRASLSDFWNARTRWSALREGGVTAWSVTKARMHVGLSTLDSRL